MSDKIKKAFNDQGVVSFEAKYTWKNSIIRIMNIVLNIVSRSGWNDPSVKIEVVMQHRELKAGMTFYAVLDHPSLEHFNIDYSKDGKESIVQYHDKRGKYWDISTNITSSKDTIKLFVHDGRALSDLKIRLSKSSKYDLVI